MCATGEYSPYLTETCLNCPRGYKCPRMGLVVPETCDDGYYTNSERQLSCIICEPGRSCVNRNASEICPAGTYSPSGVNDCLHCGNGNYSSAESASCSPCPAGKTCFDPAVAPEDCAEGYYSNIGDGSCSLCQLGYKSFPNGTGCVPCNPGFYCPHPRYYLFLWNTSVQD